jgi:hypothetical protein
LVPVLAVCKRGRLAIAAAAAKASTARIAPIKI